MTPHERMRYHSLNYHEKIMCSATWSIIYKAKEKDTVKYKPIFTQKKKKKVIKPEARWRLNVENNTTPHRSQTR